MSESNHQQALIQWWDLQCKVFGVPAIALYANPNGGLRNAITGARLKREGVRRGVFDLFLAVRRGGYGGLYIEMKHGSNRLTDEQAAFRDHVEAEGYVAAVCYGWNAAASEIERYLKG